MMSVHPAVTLSTTRSAWTTRELTGDTEIHAIGCQLPPTPCPSPLSAINVPVFRHNYKT